MLIYSITRTVILENCINYVFHKLSKEFNRKPIPKFSIGEKISRIEILDDGTLYVYINCIIIEVQDHEVTFSSEECWIKESDSQIELEEKNSTGFFAFNEEYKIFR